MKYIKNVKVILKDEIVEGKGVLFDEEIKGIFAEDEIEDLLGGKEEIEVIDGKGKYLAPGFIDIHIHGAVGYDTMDATPEALQAISKALVKSGVTSFLPTTMSMPEDDTVKAMENARKMKEEGTEGARILGVHAEGPFLNPEYKGCHAEEDIIIPRKELIDEFTDLIRHITIAPEREGARELIRYLTDKGITVSIGHSAASYEDVLEAKKWGVNHATHLFNAMTGLHHRRPGVVGAVLTEDLTCEVISDFIHLHPATIKLVLRAKDVNDIILVTDQMEAGSMGDGEYSLGGKKVIVKDGAARLENGQLAGSVLTLDRAVRNILSLEETSLVETIRMVTANPARVIGVEDKYGQIKEGYAADLVLLNEEIMVESVYVGGEKVD